MNGLSVIWLGTAGILFFDGKSSVLIDPYVSRYPLARYLPLFKVSPRRDLIGSCIEKLPVNSFDAVIISHSHIDHLVDAPAFAEIGNSMLYGSSSTANYGGGYGLQENRIYMTDYNEEIKVGDFTITFLESRHGPAFLGKVPYQGNIEGPLESPAKVKDFRLGKIFSLVIKHGGRTFVHHGSAGYKEGMYNNIKADVIFLGIGGRDTSVKSDYDYIEKTVINTGARVCVPIHYDNMFRPLNKPMKHLPGVKYKKFLASTEKYHEDFLVRILTVGKSEII